MASIKASLLKQLPMMYTPYPFSGMAQGGGGMTARSSARGITGEYRLYIQSLGRRKLSKTRAGTRITSDGQFDWKSGPACSRCCSMYAVDPPLIFDRYDSPPAFEQFHLQSQTPSFCVAVIRPNLDPSPDIKPSLNPFSPSIPDPNLPSPPAPTTPPEFSPDAPPQEVPSPSTRDPEVAPSIPIEVPVTSPIPEFIPTTIPDTTFPASPIPEFIPTTVPETTPPTSPPEIPPTSTSEFLAPSGLTEIATLFPVQTPAPSFPAEFPGRWQTLESRPIAEILGSGVPRGPPIIPPNTPPLVPPGTPQPIPPPVTPPISPPGTPPPIPPPQTPPIPPGMPGPVPPPTLPPGSPPPFPAPEIPSVPPPGPEIPNPPSIFGPTTDAPLA